MRHHIGTLREFAREKAALGFDTIAWERLGSSWSAWWMQLHVLLALRSDPPASTQISIDPALFSAECRAAAIATALSVADVSADEHGRTLPHQIFRNVARPTYADVHMEEQVRAELRRRT